VPFQGFVGFFLWLNIVTPLISPFPVLIFDDFEYDLAVGTPGGCVLVRQAAALRTMRSDLAVRPCLPITRPRSSFATRSSSIEAVSPRVSLTSTALGLLTNCCRPDQSHDSSGRQHSPIQRPKSAIVTPMARRHESLIPP
jgi:hypothetical protein